VDFVRYLVPGLPMSPADYSASHTYQAAMNLKRFGDRNIREKLNPAARAERLAKAPLSPRRALAASLATLIPIMEMFTAPEELEKLWGVIRDRWNYSENQIGSLKALVETESPAVVLRPPRGVQLPHTLKVVANTRELETAAA